MSNGVSFAQSRGIQLARSYRCVAYLSSEGKFSNESSFSILDKVEMFNGSYNELPEWLSNLSKIEDYLVYIPGWMSRIGNGVHLGNGLSITAKHVYSDTAPPAPDKFSGKKPINNAKIESFYLLESPRISVRDRELLNRQGVDFKNLQAYQDWVLIEQPGLAHQSGAFEILSPAEKTPKGERLWILGRPYGGNSKIQVTSGKMGKMAGSNFVIEGAPAMPGFSGGPVFNNKGRLIGIVFAMDSNTIRLAAVSLSSVIRVVEKKSIPHQLSNRKEQ